MVANVHILFLTDNFPPEVNAPASRTFEHAREWVKAGHKVTVITCAPNFPRGQIYAGYHNRLLGRETIEGIQVVRVWTYIAANEGFVKRTLDYLSFMVSAVLASFSVRNFEVIVATSPQFFTACAGRIVGAIRRRPFIFELRDIWPESIRAVGAIKDGPLLRALEAVELRLYKGAAGIVAVTNSFRTSLIDRGIDPKKIQVVMNGVDLSRFSPRPRDQALATFLGFEGKFVVGYVGTHGMAHALETVLDAASRLRDRCDLRFLFLGDGASKASLVAKAYEMELSSVIFIDSISKEEVPRYWSLLDASIIHLKKTELFKTVIPSKLFECMAMGVPVLHGVAGESADIVKAEGCGQVFEPENAGELARAIAALMDSPAPRRAFSERGPIAAKGYDRKAQASKMLGIIGSVADSWRKRHGA